MIIWVAVDWNNNDVVSASTSKTKLVSNLSKWLSRGTMTYNEAKSEIEDTYDFVKVRLE